MTVQMQDIGMRRTIERLPPRCPDVTREDALAELARLEGRRWAVLDFETASFLEPRVIEVGLVGSDGAVLLESLVDPRIPITEQVTGIHGLTNADVDGAPAWPSVQRELARVLRAHGIEVLVAFNASFEAMCLAYNAEAYGIEGLDVELVCVQRVAVGLLGPGENGWLSLQAACARVGTGLAPTHRAVADCAATAELAGALRTSCGGSSPPG